jgi:hypothetical protein
MQTTTPVPVNATWQPTKWDRPFFISMLVAVWLAILSGFAYNNIQKYPKGNLTYPWIVHIHVAFFTGWLLLFTAQMVLVHRGKVSTHRRLGI